MFVHCNLGWKYISLNTLILCVNNMMFPAAQLQGCILCSVELNHMHWQMFEIDMWPGSGMIVQWVDVCTSKLLLILCKMAGIFSQSDLVELEICGLLEGRNTQCSHQIQVYINMAECGIDMDDYKPSTFFFKHAASFGVNLRPLRSDLWYPFRQDTCSVVFF